MPNGHAERSLAHVLANLASTQKRTPDLQHRVQDSGSGGLLPITWRIGNICRRRGDTCLMNTHYAELVPILAHAAVQGLILARTLLHTFVCM